MTGRRPSAECGLAGRLEEPLNPNVLDERPDAEDADVKDLKRHLRNEKDAEGDPLKASSLPEVGTAREDLLCPDIGRLKDVAQPGGFRRHFVRDKPSSASERRLVQILLPMIRQRDLVDGDDNGDDGVAPDASNAAVAFVIAKNFFGSCFMITPKGFQEAGLLGGPLCLLTIYLMEVRCMLSLIKCRQKKGAGFRYEDLGTAISPWFPAVITNMIVLCQFGFCCIWLVCNAQNLGMVIPSWTMTQRLWIQLPILLPLCFIRKLSVFAYTNVIGIGFTCILVVFFFYFMGDKLAYDDPLPESVYFNTTNNDWLLWLGACAYAYEGINIVLPTYESAKCKENVPKLLVSITSFNTIVYIVFGCLTYAALGPEVASMASLNLPIGSLEGRLIPATSVIIGLVSFPLQAFVVFQTYEPKMKWADTTMARKWQKNLGRTCVLIFTVGTTWAGGDQLQNFLALVGGVCCASLALIFPAMLNLAICKPTGIAFVADVVILIAGITVLLLSSVQAFASWK